MFHTLRKARDAFRFSLGGARIVSSFAATPAVADDRINKIWDEKIRHARREGSRPTGDWLQNGQEAAQHCA